MPILGANSSGGSRPSAPVIGSATDGGTGTTVSVAFTPSTYIGKGTITYTALSSPGSLTGTGSGSPITVSGLTTGTAYTFTVKGDTNYGVASDYSAASNSVTPASPSSYESIATFTPTSGTSVTFSSIPQTYKSLQLRIITFGTGDLYLRFNGVTSNAYNWHVLGGDGSSPYAQGVANTNLLRVGTYTASGNATYANVTITDIIDYTSTIKNKTIRSIEGTDRNGTSIGELSLWSGAWRNTDAINSITVAMPAGAYGTGSSIALYGVK